MKRLLQKIRQLLRDRRFRRIWYRGVSSVAALVVFVTTYALVLPAITMESQAACGKEAHQHDESCYEEILICGLEESAGHHHSGDCYADTQALICSKEEHRHTDSCYDAEGNLVCSLEEHAHDDGCYQQKRVLVCGQEESEGHTHSAACYDKVLVCGKEAHIHSTECYREDSTAVAASTGSASTESMAGKAGFADTEAAAGKEVDSTEAGGHNGTQNADGTQAVTAGGTDASTTSMTTNILPDSMEPESLSDGYVPSLEAIDFNSVLNKHTGFYYFHAEDGQDIPANSAAITDWSKVNDKTELASTDLVKAYFAYSIPAGSLNETNQIARYRLPYNLHLTDDQIIAINENVNGIAAGFVEPGTGLVHDEDYDNYRKYLGAEAVEGTRTPDRIPVEGTQEYISAIVKAENVFENTLDENGKYIDANGNIASDRGEYLGQDLIFIFTPYTIEKNQTKYDLQGSPTAAGERVTGWFACDFNTDQIDWTEEPFDADLDNTTMEKTAEIVFVPENKDLRIEEISRTLTFVDKTAQDAETDRQAEADIENSAETGADADSGDENAPADKKAADASTTEKTADAEADTSSTGKTADAEADTSSTEKMADADTADTKKDTEDDQIYEEGTLTAEGEGYRITMAYTREANIPGKASLLVREITPENDPEVYQACLEQANAHESTGDSSVDRQASRFFDIEIVVKDEEGQQQKIEPAAPVSVNIQLPEKKDAAKDESDKEKNSNNVSSKNEDSEGSDSRDAGNAAKSAVSAQDPTVLHFAEEGVEQVEAETSVNENRKDTATEVQFQAESFSIYGVIYTVDFHWEVDGKTYEYNLAGGDSVSFRELLKLLHVIDAADGMQENDAEKNGSLLDKITGLFKNAQEQDAASEESNQEETVGSEDNNQGQAVGSEEINQFIADIASVRFSDESLVKVAPITEEITAGALKDQLGLMCEYSADLSDAQRRAMDSKTFYPTDWVLISLKAFDTEEYLTVAMNDGEEFRIRVTDARIKKTMIDARGDTWEITVTYDEDAQIPDEAELKVREILSTDEEYASLLNNAAAEACSDAQKQGISMPILSGARLFDIEIRDEEGKIEPSAPVQVDIRLIGTAAADHTSVVHFEEDGVKALTAQTSEVHMPEVSKSDAEVSELSETEEAEAEAQDPTEKEADSERLDSTGNEAEAERQEGIGKSDGNEVAAEAQDPTAKEADRKAVTEISFKTDSFSVYSVVNVTNMGNIVGSDKKFALVTGIANDPGATTGYGSADGISWGTDYFTIIVNAHAMSDQYFLDSSNAIDGFRVEPVHAYEDGSISYVGGNPAQWQFESAGNGKYYLSVNGKYLQRFNKGDYNSHQYGWEARLVDNRNQATQLSITVNNDGTILIYDDRGNGQPYYLHNDGNGPWATRVYKFRNTDVDTSSQAYRFRVCQEADQFDSFAARKVSVQNLTVNDSFLIYHKFEDSQGNEQLFALASDGTFVRVYDGGDTVYWRETNKNLYWNYRLEGNYYSIYSTDPLTNETVYINPMHSSEPPRMITREPSRLTLIGRDNGEYGTTIENWDQTAYDYAGLHVTVNEQGQASLSTGTRVAGTSDTFLFAVASNMPGETAETVETVDSEALGIHITVFDYGDKDHEYNAGDKLDSMAEVVASDKNVANSYQPHQANSLVKPYLEDDLPSSKTKGAMTGLFTENGSAVTYSKSGVTKLFLKSYYDENGMFRYRSEDNFAYLGYDNTEFTVYRQAATPYPYDTAPGHTYYTHGHYMPFNDIDMTKNVSRLMNQYGNAYDPSNPDEIVGELPVGDGRTYEDIYGTQGIPNFYTGMKMEAQFTQLKDGRCYNGDPMVFKFTGDDDMWVYIDGVLVLDIGGIHEPLSGSIDFSTGKVYNPTGSSLAGEKTLYDIFMAVLSDNSTPQSVKDKINSITWKDVNGDNKPDTFADYTNHDFKAFYMERGAGASNLDMQFNLRVVRPDEFVVEKQIPEETDPRFVNQEYRFQATFKDYINNNEIKPLYKNATYGNKGEKVCTKIIYKNRTDEKGNPVEVPVDENGYFTLKAGEAAIFMMADQKIEYTVKEVEINPGLTQEVEINDQVVTVSSGTAEAAYARVSDRSHLNYKNHPYLQNLNIIKHLLPANTQAGAGDVFEFRVYLESTMEQDGEIVHQLVPYSYGPYYVTKLVGGVTHYYTLTGANNAPVDQGTTPVVCSTTGRSGSINSIPPEYTVVIPNLAVGTHFYIEERRDNIPAGFVFDHEDLIAGTYDTETLGSTEDIISRILARDEKDHQTFDPETIGKIKKGVDASSEIFNRKVYVNVQKKWLRLNGQTYTLEEARRLPGSTNAVITAELWKKKTTQQSGGETDTPVTVTFMVNTTAEPEYRQVSVPVTIKSNSTLEFSLGANKTSQAQEIHSNPAYTISRSSVSSNPKIQYSNGRKKDKWSKYTISGITENTTVYATFDEAKVSEDFVGLYIASMEEPGASTAVSDEEKVADITLNDGNDWLQQFSMEPGYTYFLMNVAETGLGDHAHKYTFIDTPAVTQDADGNLTLAVANKYREPINITVEKVWSPALTDEEEDSAYVLVELHRYAKKTKGLLGVVLKDNYGAPIEGAVFKLYKDGAVQEEEYITDVNGKVTVNSLEPGTYRFKQISTPEGYSMSDSPPQTGDFVVTDNTTDPQEKIFELQNQALETNGVATLTLLDNNGAPIPGARYNLIKKENNIEVVIKEGLETDQDGKITVGQLKAGTYYFFETEPPTDYNLPNDWQDTDFTVLERPGTVQYFNISMVNNLKGKGYVTVTLTGPGGQPISGALFELYRDNEKLMENTTGGDGRLTFGDPDRLATGTYYVKQVTTNPDLLPANQQSFTIHDNGNANQENNLIFTNPYRGMGTVTVTLTRKDNNTPISDAKFELYKDGEYLMEGTTNSNGLLTFGDPDKLSVGNYSIKQITTAADLEPVVNSWPFAILENGDPNQTKSWVLQNEENAGNVTIKLWRKGGKSDQWNWEGPVTIANLKPGKTYWFTAELKQGLYPNNIWYFESGEDNLKNTVPPDNLRTLDSSGWDSDTNKYHFSITPVNDNATYSYALVTSWGVSDIYSITMDEASRQAIAPAFSRSQAKSAEKLATSKTRLLSSADDSVQAAQNDTPTVDTGSLTNIGEPSNGTSLRASQPAVSPSGPPSADYIEDPDFKETYKITKTDDNWKHVFENLDKVDRDENPYYYYVVETECVPDHYQIAAYANDNLTDTGTITITNTEKKVGIEFTKRWLDVAGQVESWPEQTITVTVTGTGSTETKEYVYQIGKNDVSTGALIQALRPADAPKLKVESKENNSYKFTLDDLLKTDSSHNDYTYTISETGYPGGYQPPAYFDSSGEPVERGVTKISSGGTIVNAVAGYELPSTGGPGTQFFTFLGMILIAGAGLLLRRKQRFT